MTQQVFLPTPRLRNTDADSSAQPVDLPPARPDGSRALLDRFGRQARDLRVSLTDKCNLRCTYCMPAEGFEWLPKEQTLSDAEVIRLITLGVEKLGIRQVRFTGGEPLLRRGLADIIAATKRLTTDEGTAPSTALTTNGLGLDKKARTLADAGLDRINVSLDTIDAERYRSLTRRDRLAGVMASLDAAAAAGLYPIKVNAVVMPGVNEDDIVPLAQFCLDRGLQLRFIEQMPLGPREQWNIDEMVTADDILARLREHLHLSPAVAPRGSAPAALWDVAAPAGAATGAAGAGETIGQIGIIASVTRPFCADCDRTRLTADGMVRNCLFGNSETNLRDLLRAGASDAEIAAAWAGEMWRKKPGHGIDDEGFLQPDRPMAAIGG